MAVLTDQAVADQLAIRQLTAAFSDAVTRRDYDAFRTVWAEDGRWNVPGMATQVGPDAAAAQLGQLLDGIELLVQMVDGGQVWVDGDAARARWTISEHGRLPDGRGVHYIGIYQDRHVRTPDGWRFAERTFTFLYRGFSEMPGKAYPPPPVER